MEDRADNPEPRVSSRWTWAALAAILLAAAALRFHALASVPPGFWIDEALNAGDAVDVARGGALKLVYPDLFPREPMFVTLLAGWVRVFGGSVGAMRALPALIGLLSVAALFFCVRACAEDRAALLAAASLALMRWHVLFSRLLFRTILLPLWMPLIVWAAASARRRPTPARALALGALTGGGFYTYLSWYFMLPLVAGLLIWVFHDRWREAAGRRLALTCLAAASIVAAPLGIHYVRSPDHFLARPGAVSPFREGTAAGLAEIGENFVEALGMFHVRGDHVAKQNIPNDPALDRLAGAAFALGLLAAAARLRRRCALSAIALSWLALGMMPTVFAKTDSPNFLRTLVAAPAVAILIALGLGALVDWIASRAGGRRWLRPLAAGFAVAIVFASGAITARDLFGAGGWAARPDVWAGFNGAEVQLAAAANAKPEGATFWYPAAVGENLSFAYLTRDTPGVIGFANFDFLRPGSPGEAGPRWIVATARNQLLRPLEALVPSGRVARELIAPEGNAWAIVYEVPLADLPSPGAVNRAESIHPAPRLDVP